MTNLGHGQLYGIGLGPGDPELITIKGQKRLSSADVIAYPASAEGKRSLAWQIAAPYVNPKAICIPMAFPVTGRGTLNDPNYRKRLSQFYDESAETLRKHLEMGHNVALPVLGDPLIYGSFIYWYQRLSKDFAVEIIPGVSALTGGASRLATPLCLQEDVLALIPATLNIKRLKDTILATEAFVIFKLGGHLAKVKSVLHELNLNDRALYIERATMNEEHIIPLAKVDEKTNPYFALIVVPTAREGT